MDSAPSGSVPRLSLVVGAAAIVASVPGALLGGFGEALGPEVESVRGDPVVLYGRGVYEYDSRFVGAGNRATDVVVFLAALPTLTVALLLYRRASAAGALLLFGTLAFFTYVYGTYAVGIAYNPYFLVYVLIFAASLFALILLGSACIREARNPELSPARRRLIGWFMLASAAVLLAVWGIPLVAAVIGQTTPARLDTYATFVTYAIDLGIILPAAVVAGVMVLRGRAEGYVVAVSLLVIEVLLAPLIALQTVSQIRAGEEFSTAEAIGPIGGFVLLASVAAFVLASILQAHYRVWSTRAEVGGAESEL